MKKNITIWILSVLVIFLLINLMVMKNMFEKMDNMIIWELSQAQVEWDISFVARVDTWAQTTSIHAENIEIENAEKKQKDNIWKNISFSVINNNWEKEIFTKKIEDVRNVKTSEGNELRYYIMMDITAWNKTKSVLVNLNDREEMNYKLLLGRNFLEKDFLIQISEQ